MGCYIKTADYSSENRFYKMDKDDVNKNFMASIALSAYTSNAYARLAFWGDNLDCNNISQSARVMVARRVLDFYEVIIEVDTLIEWW